MKQARYRYLAEKDFGTQVHSLPMGTVSAATAKEALAKIRRRYSSAEQVSISGDNGKRAGWIAAALSEK